ncbi:MAG: SLC13 family permease, partial [bacterium]
MDGLTTSLALAIFALTYLIIASQKIPYWHLDRPSGALTGAVLMVVAGVLTLDEAYHAINFDTITLLLGMMILVGYLRFARFFRYDARRQSAEHAGRNIFWLELWRFLLADVAHRPAWLGA